MWIWNENESWTRTKPETKITFRKVTKFDEIIQYSSSNSTLIKYNSTLFFFKYHVPFIFFLQLLVFVSKMFLILSHLTCLWDLQRNKFTFHIQLVVQIWKAVAISARNGFGNWEMSKVGVCIFLTTLIKLHLWLSSRKYHNSYKSKLSLLPALEWRMMMKQKSKPSKSSLFTF